MGLVDDRMRVALRSCGMQNGFLVTSDAADRTSCIQSGVFADTHEDLDDGSRANATNTKFAWREQDSTCSA